MENMRKQSQQHMSAEVSEKLKELNRTLSQWNRNTSRDYLVLVVPFNPDEDLIGSLSGHPIPDEQLHEPVGVLEGIMMEREERKNA